MHGDLIVKAIQKTFDKLDIKPPKEHRTFRIPKKALVVMPEFIGDSILLIPFIRNLRYNLGSKTQIDVIVTNPVKNLIETLPYFDKVRNGKNIRNKSFFLRKEKYDTVFLFNYPLKWIFASCKANTKQRIGLSTDRLGLNSFPFIDDLLTNVSKTTSIADALPQHIVYLNVLSALNLKKYDEHLEMNLTQNDRKKAKNLLKGITGLKIGIQITAGSIGKEWGLENWAELIKYLSLKYNCSFISTGVEKETSIYDTLSEVTGVKIHNFCGQTTIRESIALYEHYDAIITLDSSPAHLAALARVKNIVVIYGPTNHKQWKPQSDKSNIVQIYSDLECRPCLTRLCPNKICLNSITPKKVIEEIEKLKM